MIIVALLRVLATGSPSRIITDDFETVGFKAHHIHLSALLKEKSTRKPLSKSFGLRRCAGSELVIGCNPGPMSIG